MAHPAVAEAAVIAIPDEKWAERPLAAVVLKEGASATADELREFLAPQFAKWWLPERSSSSPRFRRRASASSGRPHCASSSRRSRRRRVEGSAPREVDGPFELADLPDPAADDGKVVVRVRAAGINFADVLIRRGRYPQMPELPAVLGSEIAGELEDGTRVMAITSGSGGYAELAAVDRAQVVPLPDQASFAEGASFLLTFLTAYIPLTRQVRVRPRIDACSCTRPPAASAPRRSRWRARSARESSPPSARRRSSTCAASSAPRRRTSYDELPDDLRVDVVVDPVGGELFDRDRSRVCKPLGTVVAIGSAAGAWTGDQPGAARRAQRRPLRLLPRPAAAPRARGRRRGGRRAARALADGRAAAARRSRAPARRGRAGARARRVAHERRQGGAHPVRALITGGRGGIGRAIAAALGDGSHRARPAGVRRRLERVRGARSTASSTRRSSTPAIGIG